MKLIIQLFVEKILIVTEDDKKEWKYVKNLVYQCYFIKITWQKLNWPRHLETDHKFQPLKWVLAVFTNQKSHFNYIVDKQQFEVILG